MQPEGLDPEAASIPYFIIAYEEALRMQDKQDNQSKIEQLQKIIDESSSIVFFGGAGVSTESGIPDFRSTSGLYHQQWAYPPETILSHSFFETKTEEFYKFYREKMLFLDAEPNAAHKALAKLEEKGKLKAVVTQNIDGLHQKAGSKNVFELHGSVLRNYCRKCGAFYDAKFIKNYDGSQNDGSASNYQRTVPRCTKDSCHGLIKPDVVLYEEGLDNNVIEGAVAAISSADCLIIGGTSLVVYPAAGLVRYFHGKYLVLINKSSTSYDASADLAINEPIGEVFSKLKI